MEKSIYDLWVDELLERQRMVRTELQERFKKTKPFRMEKMSPEEKIAFYESWTPSDEQRFIQEEGPEAVNDFIREMEMRKGGTI